MESNVLFKAHSANLAYQTFQLRLVMALSMSRFIKPEQACHLSIGDAIESLNTSIGMRIDSLCIDEIISLKSDHAFIELLSELRRNHPLVACHLRSIHGDLSGKDLKAAIAAHPDCEFLYQWFVSPHRSFLGTQPEIRKRYMQRFGRIDLPRLNRRLYFSPMLQISIGHWFHLCNSIRCAEALHIKCPPVTVFVAEVDSGLSLIEFLNASGTVSISVEHHDSILGYALSDARELYSSDYYLADISPQFDNLLQHQISGLSHSQKLSKCVYFHLRTASYKNDHRSFHASLRNVNPYTYVGTARYLQKVAAVEPVLITADTSIPDNLPLTVHQVTDNESEHIQWKFIRESQFSVGTPSGISQLFNLGSGCTLRTNNNGLALEDIFSSIHLIACKRFQVDNNLAKKFSVAHLAYLICLPWEIPDGLASFASIRDLSCDELILASKDFLGIYQGNRKPPTLYDIFNSFGLLSLKDVVPNRNISSTTAKDILRTLSSNRFNP